MVIVLIINYDVLYIKKKNISLEIILFNRLFTQFT